MTGNELDEILAESATPETQEPTTQETETTTETQPRDETGRFAAKAEKTEETQHTETTVEEEPAETGKVPQQALHASRQKEKEARQEAEQLRQQIAQMQGQIQLLNQRQATPQPQKTEEAAKPVDFWESPDGYLESKLSPIQQMMQQQREEFSKALAIQSHGQDTVDNAYKAFVEAAQVNPGAYAGEYQAMMKSANPYDALVQWHKRQQTLQTVGNDPNAWLEAEMEKRLSDPAYQAKVLEKIKGTAAANTTRSNPVTQLPPSLNRLPAGGNLPDDGDMSDAALFSNAMR